MPDQILGAATGLTLGLVAVALWQLARTTAAVARAERKLDALLKHSGIDFADAAVREATALVRAGRKIEAIKVYRELTGAGLAEAKTAVEKL